MIKSPLGARSDQAPEGGAKGLDILARVAQACTYKPDHEFLVRQVDELHALVSLRANPLDSRLNGSTIRITINVTVALRDVHTETDALNELARVVAAYELHESAEWFRYRDATVFLPHEHGDEFGQLSWQHFNTMRRAPMPQ